MASIYSETFYSKKNEVATLDAIKNYHKIPKDKKIINNTITYEYDSDDGSENSIKFVTITITITNTNIKKILVTVSGSSAISSEKAKTTVKKTVKKIVEDLKTTQGLNTALETGQVVHYAIGGSRRKRRTRKRNHRKTKSRRSRK